MAPAPEIREEVIGPSAGRSGHGACSTCGLDATLVTAAMASQTSEVNLTRKTLESTILSLDKALQAQGTLAKRVEALEAGIAAASSTRIPTVERVTASVAKTVPAPAPVAEKSPLERASEMLNARCAELLTASAPVGRGVKRAAVEPAPEPPANQLLKKRLEELFAR